MCAGNRPEEGLVPVCWQERAGGELLCSCRAVAGVLGGISVGNLLWCWTAVPCPARSVGLSFPVPVVCLEQGRAEEPPARWLWGSAWAPPCRLCVPRSRARERCRCRRCWEAELLLRRSWGCGSAGSPAAPLTPLPRPGLLHLAQPLLWHRGELQALPLSGGAGSLWRLQHRDLWLQSLSPAPRSRWCPEPGLQSGTVFPFPLPEQRPGLSKEEGKEALLTLAWERGAPGRAQEAAELAPRSPPCTLPYLPQQEPGSALAGCSPASPPLLSAVLGWGLSPPSWGQGGLCPTAQPPLRRHGPACGSDWDRTAAWWSFTTQTQRFPLPFLCFQLVPRVFIREQQRVKKVVAVVSVSFSPLLFTLFAQDTR